MLALVFTLAAQPTSTIETTHAALTSFLASKRAISTSGPPPVPSIPTEGFTSSMHLIYTTPSGNLTGQGTTSAAGYPSKAQVQSLMVTALLPDGTRQGPLPQTTVTFANNSQVLISAADGGYSAPATMGVKCTKKPDPALWVASAVGAVLSSNPETWTYIGNTFCGANLVAGYVGEFYATEGAPASQSALFTNVFGGGLAAISMSDATTSVTSTVLFDELVAGPPDASLFTLPEYIASQCV
jgi:hypothetical protein